MAEEIIPATPSGEVVPAAVSGGRGDAPPAPPRAAAGPIGTGELPPLKGATLFLLTVAVSMATFMEVLDTTIVNVSVPSIAGSLGVSSSEGTWAVSSYMLAAAVMQPLTGWLGRRFGEVRTFLTSITLFMVFSALCGLAVSMPMLVVCRLIQGFVSGPMMSLAQALLLRNYPPEKRGVAIGLWSMVIITAPVFGPILGGLITDNLSWPWLFYINLPVGISAFAVIASVLRGRESKIVKLPIDIVGLVLLVIGVGALQYMLDNGNEKDWFSSPIILAAGVISAVSIAFLIPWELTDKHPVVDLHFFQRRNFLIGAGSIGLAMVGFMGANIIFPLWLQTTVGYTSSAAGLTMAPIGILPVLIAPILGRNIQKVNLRLATSFAFVVFSINMFRLSEFTDSASFWQYLSPRFWQGLGIAFFFLPLNQIMLSQIKPDEIASASGLSNFLRTISGSITTALTIWIWNRRSDFHHVVLSEHIRDSAGAWTHYQSQLNGAGIAGSNALQYANQLITRQSMTLGANDVFHAFGILFLLLVPLVWFAKPPFGARGADGAH